jgi:predicted transposase/invertase (TIGR01784 family)
MQMTWTESFKKRVLLNASKAYVAQTEKGMNYASLQPVYALNFVNAVFLDDVDGYYHYYHLVHDKYTDKVIDGLHLIFVELPKFKPTTFSERKMQVLWLRFLTEINEKTREVPAELLENAEVSEALEILERAAFTDEEMFFYDKFWDRVSTQRTFEEETRQKAEERVMLAKKDAEELMKQAKAKVEQAEAKVEQAEAKVEQAEAKVEQAEAKVKQTKAEAEAKVEQTKAEAEAKLEAELKKKDIDTARKMKQLGLDSAFISQVTNLSAEQVEAL